MLPHNPPHSTPLPHHRLPGVQINIPLRTVLECCSTSLIVHLYMLEPGCWGGSEGVGGGGGGASVGGAGRPGGGRGVYASHGQATVESEGVE